MKPTRSPKAHASPCVGFFSRASNHGLSAAVVALVVLGFASLSVRLLEPSNIYDKDQPGVIGHVVDVAVHDHWLVQWEVGHGYATKPPLYPWIAGLGLKVRLWLGGSDELVHPL